MAEHFRDRINPPDIREIFDLWMSSRPDARYPAHEDLDLMSIPKLVKSCFVMDALGDRRFRYRFVGTDIDRHIGFPMTGRRLDEVRRGQLHETLTELFATVEETGQAGYAETHMRTETRENMIYHRLALPLSTDGEAVDRIFGGHLFERAETRTPGRPYVEANSASREGRVRMFFEPVARGA